MGRFKNRKLFYLTTTCNKEYIKRCDKKLHTITKIMMKKNLDHCDLTRYLFANKLSVKTPCKNPLFVLY